LRRWGRVVRGALHPPRSHTRAFPFHEEKKVLSVVTMILGITKSWIGMRVHWLWAEGLARLCWWGLLAGLQQGGTCWWHSDGWFCWVDTTAAGVGWGESGVWQLGTGPYAFTKQLESNPREDDNNNTVHRIHVRWFDSVTGTGAQIGPDGIKWKGQLR